MPSHALNILCAMWMQSKNELLSSFHGFSCDLPQNNLEIVAPAKFNYFSCSLAFKGAMLVLHSKDFSSNLEELREFTGWRLSASSRIKKKNGIKTSKSKYHKM